MLDKSLMAFQHAISLDSTSIIDAQEGITKTLICKGNYRAGLTSKEILLKEIEEDQATIAPRNLYAGYKA